MVLPIALLALSAAGKRLNEHPFSFPQIAAICKGGLTAGAGDRKMGGVETPLGRWEEVLKALAHPVRLRLLALVARQELCVCQLTAVVGLAVSTVSSHLAQLRRAKLVSERKEGRWVHYALAPLPPEVKPIVEALLERLAADPQVQRDRELVARLSGTSAVQLLSRVRQGASC